MFRTSARCAFYLWLTIVQHCTPANVYFCFIPSFVKTFQVEPQLSDLQSVTKLVFEAVSSACSLNISSVNITLQDRGPNVSLLQTTWKHPLTRCLFSYKVLYRNPDFSSLALKQKPLLYHRVCIKGFNSCVQNEIKSKQIG